MPRRKRATPARKKSPARSASKSRETSAHKSAHRSKLERKQQVLSHVAPSFTSPIADAVVIKREGLFFLMERDGSVPVHDKHGLGLYYHDCRYLDGYELRVNGGAPSVLAVTASEGDRALLELTNADATS